MVSFILSGLASPLAFDVLQEFRVPGIGGVAVLAPEQHKSGQLADSELAGDIGQA